MNPRPMRDDSLQESLRSLGWSEELVKFFFSAGQVVEPLSFSGPVAHSIQPEVRETTDVNFEVDPNAFCSGTVVFKSSIKK